MSNDLQRRPIYMRFHLVSFWVVALQPTSKISSTDPLMRPFIMSVSPHASPRIIGYKSSIVPCISLSVVICPSIVTRFHHIFSARTVRRTCPSHNRTPVHGHLVPNHTAAPRTLHLCSCRTGLFKTTRGLMANLGLQSHVTPLFSAF